MKSREKKAKIKQTIDQKKIEQKENQMQLVKAKQELVKKEYQDNLKENMEQRLFDLIHKLKHVDTGKSLSTMQLKSMLTQKNIMGVSPKYNATELAMVFDYYKQFIEKINETQTFLPTKKNFCSFIGISSATYDNYKTSEDSEKREIVQMIDDYITDLQLTASQNGEVKEITTIFRTKAEHGMVEASAPVVIQHKSEVNLDKIKAQISAVNQGRSVDDAIELKMNEDGSYGG